jgi:ABC-2 type transport system permease protein
MRKKDRILKNILQLLLIFLIIALVGYLSSVWYFRLDLTSEKKYTLSKATRNILEDLQGDVFIQVYLDGDMPIGFKRLKKASRELLDEFRVYSKRKVSFDFINPSDEENLKERNKIYKDLFEKGLHPLNVKSSDKEGGQSQKTLFPGAILNYKGLKMPVNMLINNPNLPASENLNRSMENLEYEFVRALEAITADTIYKIAFLEGHGELYEPQVEDISRELSRYYTIDRGQIGGKPGILDSYAAVIIAKPVKPFSEADKLVLDQYLMQGGNILWMIDPVAVDMDSLMYSSITLAYLRDLNLNDILFKYGIRINGDLIQDIQCAQIPVNTAIVGNPPKYTPVPWLFYPLLEGSGHPVSRNLNLVRSEFASELDTLAGGGDIRKTILLKSSDFSKTFGVPNLINLADVKNPLPREAFSRKNIPVAVLLEGEFNSVFRNRSLEAILPDRKFTFLDRSKPAKMIIISDGDIIRNDVSFQGGKPFSLPLGQDRLTQQTYGNKDFILNAVSYLAGQSGLMELRGRELKLRMLDKAKLSSGKLKWQLINTILPVFLVLLFGIIAGIIRKRRYAG